MQLLEWTDKWKEVLHQTNLVGKLSVLLRVDSLEQHILSHGTLFFSHRLLVSPSTLTSNVGVLAHGNNVHLHRIPYKAALTHIISCSFCQKAECLTFWQKRGPLRQTFNCGLFKVQHLSLLLLCIALVILTCVMSRRKKPETLQSLEVCALAVNGALFSSSLPWWRFTLLTVLFNLKIHQHYDCIFFNLIN